VQASPVAQDAAAGVQEDVPEIEIIEPVPEVADAQPVSAAEEVDLSSEWASLLEETKEPEPKAEGVSPVPKVACPIERGRGGTAPIWVLEDETPVQIPDELLPHEILVAPTDDIGTPQIAVPRTPMTRKAGPARWRKFPQGRLLRQQVLRPRRVRRRPRRSLLSHKGTAAGRGIDRFASARTRRSGGRGARARPGTAAGSFAQASTRRA